MLKRCGRRLLLGLAGALLACLLVLTADPPPAPVPAERGRRALHSLVPPALGLEAAAAPRVLAREVHSLSEYFSLLTRARRDAGPPPDGNPRPADGHPRTPAEPLVPRDVFIAVKTTRKFHRARLDLLLETWISRHKEMVSPGGLARQVGWGARRLVQRRGEFPLGASYILSPTLLPGATDSAPLSPVYLLGPLSLQFWKCWVRGHLRQAPEARGPHRPYSSLCVWGWCLGCCSPKCR